MKNNEALKVPTIGSKENADLLEIIFQERLKYSALVSSAIDHGLHTPMIIIKGLAEMCLRNPDQDPRPNLKKISNEAEHILKLLSAMSIVSSTEPLQMQNLCLRNIIDRAIVFFEKRCLENGISIKIDVSDSVRVEGDPDRLRNILISLLQNAVDSFENIPPTAARSIMIHTQTHNDRLDLVISDTGGGIDPQIQKHVVDKILFGQAEASQHNTYLGLALAKKMSDDMGIKLVYVTGKDKGTSFSVSFPKKK